MIMMIGLARLVGFDQARTTGLYWMLISPSLLIVIST